VDAPAEQTAVYAIHIEGLLGPMLVSSLSEEGSAASGPWDVHTEQSSIVLVSVTDDDLVDVVRRLAASGVEIGWVRELGARAAS
jgi:hypothetical protein